MRGHVHHYGGYLTLLLVVLLAASSILPSFKAQWLAYPFAAVAVVTAWAGWNQSNGDKPRRP